MNCQDARPLLEAYLDGELDLVRTVALEAHIKGCAECLQQKASFEALRSSLRQSGVYAKAPAKLGDSISARIREEEPHSVPWAWVALAAGVTAVVMAAGFWLMEMRQPAAATLLAQEVVASHVRSLMANHLMDVVSSDQHTVKPWFNGKLDFTPLVKDLAAKGFPLVGGRLDYLDDRPVAALLYKRSQHPINVFEWPGGQGSTPESSSLRGYNIIRWSQAGMAFWVVSDLNATELGEFVRYMRR